MFRVVSMSLRLPLLISFLALLAACSTPSSPAGKEVAPYYLAPVTIDSNATQTAIETLYGGQAVVFKPEAGFAVLGFSKEQGELTTLSTEVNQNALGNPEFLALGNSAWASGNSAWASGIGAWASGYSAWSSGNSAWASGISQNTFTQNVGVWQQIQLAEGQANAPKLGQGVTVAVIDTGIDLKHPAFAGKLAPREGWKDFVDNDVNPQEEAGNAYGHGTAVAGLILQVAPNATILPIRVLSGDGVGDLDDVIAAIDWAIQQRVDVINLSVGSSENISSLRYMVDYATDTKNILLVSSSGNSGNTSVTYPAAYATSNEYGGRYAISVGSVNSLDRKSTFSTYGSKVELFAPGESLLTVLPDSHIGYVSGTSFAAPIVSGAMSLALSKNPNWYKKYFETNLRDTSDNIHAKNPGFSAYDISGRLNVAAFVKKPQPSSESSSDGEYRD
ncbi:MAG: S8 family serine peptidase [Trueperaceae bacterium]|nr:S8 family serine peptidase [Trueperaceae bacterium]